MFRSGHLKFSIGGCFPCTFLTGDLFIIRWPGVLSYLTSVMNFGVRSGIHKTSQPRFDFQSDSLSVSEGLLKIFPAEISLKNREIR